MARKDDGKVSCETPTPGKQPTNIPKWKYDAVKKAINDVIGAASNGVSFNELPHKVKERLQDEVLDELGSVNWHVTTVKLDMEAKGELSRDKVDGKQRLWRR